MSKSTAIPRSEHPILITSSICLIVLLQIRSSLISKTLAKVHFVQLLVVILISILAYFFSESHFIAIVGLFLLTLTAFRQWLRRTSKTLDRLRKEVLDIDKYLKGADLVTEEEEGDILLFVQDGEVKLFWERFEDIRG